VDEVLVTHTGRSTRGARAAATRARLQAAALELFAAQGFEGTTVEQIAAAAGVSHMTFFRHFPTKESVVVEDPYDPLVAGAVVAQPADLPVFERVRRGMRQVMHDAPPSVDLETAARIALITTSPALRARIWDNTETTSRVVSEALVADGAPRGETEAAVAACLGAITATMLAWAAQDGEDCEDDPDRPALGAAVVAALEALDPVVLATRIEAARIEAAEETAR
jgi:AcrR family transcriptional regulator